MTDVKRMQRMENSVYILQNASSCDIRFPWNPGIIEIGFQNHPPDRRRFEFEIFELNYLKNSNIGAHAPARPKSSDHAKHSRIISEWFTPTLHLGKPPWDFHDPWPPNPTKTT
jgi:hypothetical protein